MNTEKIYFIVDEFLADGCCGWTTNISKVVHNIDRFPKDWVAEFYKELAISDKGLTVFLSSGRYIIFLTIAKDKGSGSIGFFDTKGDDDLAIDMSKNFSKAHQRNEFIKQHFLLKAHYSEDYDLVELTTDFSFYN